MSNSATGRRWKGIPVPFFFQEDSAEAFHEMETKEDDVFLCSLPKGGTTWVNSILHSLLYGFDAAGQKQEEAEARPGAKVQAYPEATPIEIGALGNAGTTASQEEMRKTMFGDFTLSTLLGQSSPRLFSTHLYGHKYLPGKLVQKDGRGRLVVVVRNLKDVMCSLHFFRGEPKDGWLGNEHGKGTFRRFLDMETPNAYGNQWDWLRDTEKVIQAMMPEKRVIVVYFEALKLRLRAEVQRLASFLNIPCPQVKLDAVCAAVSFGSMKERKSVGSMLLRKGDIGDWKNHLSPALWDEFDAVFNREVGNSLQLVQPMYVFQKSDDRQGLPPRRADAESRIVTGGEDPRVVLGTFDRAKLECGMLCPDTMITNSPGTWIRPSSEVTDFVHPPGATDVKYVAESDRYHLFLSAVCPWASGIRAVRKLAGLEHVISMDVADGQSSQGWVFLSGSACADFDREPFWLHEVYTAHDTEYTGRLTVPVLWDKKTSQIVTNDSWSILKILGSSFAGLGSPLAGLPLDLAPSAEVDELQKDIYDGLLNGVYKCGINLMRGNASGAQGAARGVYDMLAALEDRLANRGPFLLGDRLTLVDVRLLMCLLRYDIAYRDGFGLGSGDRGPVIPSRRRATTVILTALEGLAGYSGSNNNGNDEARSGYPALAAYLRRGVKMFRTEIEFSACTHYYRWAVGLPQACVFPTDMQAFVEAVDAS